MNALDTLYAEVQGHRSVMPLSELLDFVRRFPRLSPFNAALVAHQRRQAIFVATEKVWHNEFARTLKPDAEPIVILHPYAPVRFVFDVSDTVGGPIPDDVVNPFKTVGPPSEEGHRLIVDGLRRKKVHIAEPADHRVAATKLAAVFAELGHLFAGHCGEYPDLGITSRITELDEEQREFEAESIAWLIAGRIGMRTSPGRFLSNYLHHEGLMPLVSRDAILHAVNAIEKLFGGALALGEMVREDTPSLFELE